jgi:hypothetical protein
MQQIEIADIDPPPLIRENSGFTFLLQRSEWYQIVFSLPWHYSLHLQEPMCSYINQFFHPGYNLLCLGQFFSLLM